MNYVIEDIQFDSLQEFYRTVESVNAFITSNISYRLKDIITQIEDESQNGKLTCEMEAFHFVLSHGKASGYIKNTLPDGISVYEYPNAKQLGDDALEYYLKRSKETSNNSLRIRYQQILVSTGKQTYLVQCLKSLIDFYVQEIETSISDLTSASSGHDLRTLIESALVLSKKAKYRITDITQHLYKLIQPQSFYPVRGKYRLLEIIYYNRRLFAKEQLHECYKTAEQLSIIPPYSEDCFAMEKLAEVSIKYAAVLQLPHKQWYEKLGSVYEAEMLKRTDDSSNMMPMHWCEKAIEQFQSAGNTEKVNELHLKYSEIRKEFKLDTFETEFNKDELTDWYDTLNKRAKYLVSRNEPAALIHYLSQGSDIFPTIASLKEGIDKQEKSFLDRIAISKADINKNFSKKIVTDDEHDLNALYESYYWRIEFSVLPYLRKLFYFGFIKQKICFPTVIQYLQKNTWIGNTLVSKDSGGEEVKYNWLSLIGPALFDFHHSLEALLFSESNRINIVLPVDSLILKFEGLFRDFARLIGSHTTVLAKGNMREMYIEELLELDRMKEYFDENDMLLFKYIFISKNGLNLRNNIAHSFFHFQDYRVEYMLLLIMALLRLGKYSINVSGQTK